MINSIPVLGSDIGPEDSLFWQPVVGSSIHATDMTVGSVEKVIIDPDNRLVKSILANAKLPERDELRLSWPWKERHYLERRVIIPVEAIRHLNSTSVFLKEKGAVVAGYKDFDPGSYFPAPEIWEHPYPYQYADILLPADAETA